MLDFRLHTPESAPAPAGDQLSAIKKAWGFIPNLHATLAASPTALAAYDTVFNLVGKGSLTPVEQQVVFLTASALNGCEYCVSGHSMLAGKAGADAATIEGLREGAPLDDAKLEALHRFAAAVVTDRGRIAPDVLAGFEAAGYTAANALDVVVIVAAKTISNYTNHLSGTPLDAFMAPTAWVAPSRRVAA